MSHPAPRVKLAPDKFVKNALMNALHVKTRLMTALLAPQERFGIISAVFLSVLLGLLYRWEMCAHYVWPSVKLVKGLLIAAHLVKRGRIYQGVSVLRNVQQGGLGTMACVSLALKGALLVFLIRLTVSSVWMGISCWRIRV